MMKINRIRRNIDKKELRISKGTLSNRTKFTENLQVSERTGRATNKK